MVSKILIECKAIACEYGFGTKQKKLANLKWGITTLPMNKPRKGIEGSSIQVSTLKVMQ